MGKGLEGFAGLTRLTGLKRFNAEENLQGCLSVYCSLFFVLYSILFLSSGFNTEEKLAGVVPIYA